MRRFYAIEELPATDSPTVEETLLILTTLSVPFIRMHTHSRCSGPIFASHALDLQTMPAFADPTWAEQGKMHTGGPASNVEVVLKGPEVERLEKGLDPIGQVRQQRNGRFVKLKGIDTIVCCRSTFGMGRRPSDPRRQVTFRVKMGK